uniref:G protein-coupled receptor n=1 Tax=Ditylenchus dipsaci TaxID=166011 RepID=A0A915EIW0_9BILA
MRYMFTLQYTSPSVTRMDVWFKNNTRCHSKFTRHYVCIYGLEDVPTNLNNSHSMFANKMLPSFDYGAIYCCIRRCYNRLTSSEALKDFASVYLELPQVRYHAEKKRLRNNGPTRNCLISSAPTTSQLKKKLKMYNAYTQEQWQSLGNKRPFIGACFVVIGVCTQAIYILFLIAMMKKRFRSLSCYKIMFFLGIVDMGNIVGGAFGTGYLTCCTHPTLIYFIGANGVSCWCTACLTCCLLASTAALTLHGPIFLTGCLQAIRLGLAYYTQPLLHTHFTFEMPVIYDSNYVTWFYDPFFAVPIHYDFHNPNADNMWSSDIHCYCVVYMNYFYMPPWLTMISTLAYVLMLAHRHLLTCFRTKVAECFSRISVRKV